VIVRKIALLLATGSIFVLGACGGSGGGGSNSPTITSVNVSCTPNLVGSGGSAQCSAAVSGTGSFSTAVTWTASAGSISSSGVLTAPAVAGTGTPGGGGTSNVQPIVVDSGPQPQTFGAVNVAYTTVTVCAPGTNNCQNIDHVQVDTGSEGLRLIAGVLDSASVTVTATSTQDMTKSGTASVTATLLPLSSVNECLVFADGYVWGPVGAADISFAGATGETSPSTPVQIIIPSSVAPAVPSSCSSQNPSGGAGNEGGSVMAFGANGILGVGPFQTDCGGYCVQEGMSCGSSNQPCVYYTCSGSTCSGTNVALNQQVFNPVIAFGIDNNGVLIQLPSVPNGGSQNPTGSLIFGISTQSNNKLTLANNLYQIPDTGNNAGDFITTFNGQSYSQSFIDSGSNGLFFLDTSTTGIPTCASPNQPWYCPNTSPDSLTATNQGQNSSGQGVGPAVPVSFTVEDATTLFSTNNTAFSTLAGPNAGAFDWGLSFFYGRNMFTAIDGAIVSGAPNGPFFAY
jgi:hypothetical protein